MADPSHPIPSSNGPAISAGMLRRSTRGFLTGAARLGYRSERTGDGVRPVPNQDLAPLLREAFSLALRGEPLRSVVAFLRSQGVAGLRGGPIGLATVQRMLADPFYAGFGEDDTGRAVPGQHEALVSPVVFAALQRRMLARRRSFAKST